MMSRRTLGVRCHARCAPSFRWPDKNRDNALNRVLYTYDDLSFGRFASDESCFKYNIRDAMPSICYDDDSANEKNHWGNRRNCIDAAPFSLWLVTSFFFASHTHRHRRSHRSIVIVAPGFYCILIARGLVGGSRDIESDDSPRSKRGPRLLSFDVSYSDYYIRPRCNTKMYFSREVVRRIKETAMTVA